MNFFGTENLITVIVGFIVSSGLTQIIKNKTGVAAFGATLLAFCMAFAVAIVAVVINSALTGNFSVENIASQGLQIFALATFAYKAILADK